jgi:serine/threonine-protein kinase
LETDVRPKQLGAWRTRGKIGEGGMATVYVGRNDAGDLCALKVIKADFVQNRDFVSMFLDEAKIATRLQHPNIVRVSELGSEDDRMFMVMELLRGQSLHAVWAQARKRKTRVPPDVAAYIGASMAAGLHHAHEAKDEEGRALQIVHRDVNPSNVIITYDGDVKVIDFGLAKAVNRVSQTAAGIVKGKISYLSPEQVTGKPVDRRADVFSLGTTIWEISLDRRLFKAETKVDTVHKIHHADVPDPLSIDPEYPVLLWSVLLKCLKRDPKDRHQTADEAAAAFREFLESRSSTMSSMKTKLAGLMTTLFEDEREKQEQWLLRATASDAKANLPPMRPKSAVLAAFESLPVLETSKAKAQPVSAATSPLPLAKIKSGERRALSDAPTKAEIVVATPRRPPRPVLLALLVVLVVAACAALGTRLFAAPR